MSIYKLKLGFWGFLIVLGRFSGLWTSPHQSMIFWAPKMKF